MKPIDNAAISGMKAYLRVCSSGGMPLKKESLIMAAVEEAARLGYFTLAINDHEALRAENERLRDLIKGIRKHADEWAVSRMTGNPQLENEKGEKLWQSIRRASGMTAPIHGSTVDPAKETK